ncbi:GPP34 family phosphoprotein [Micromonospora krabiensis]|uniref:Golgi phosphoprotein 3 (GPP34) n=1 Tax=Micromonospora krabiensis TaxID=307121 RepID=A0A1C3MWR0_9ACTN|nr:GPP34 family phosphoprotein [Micromonospora krabiensis]SBV24772.1 Golgi phosphoprotein 3 (GPP34) [Micromonospora krabiensis]
MASTARLPLRDELFLLGHDDDTGQPHLHRHALAVGLAGAVLIDLFLAGRITITPHGGPVGEQRPRARSVHPVGDLITDSALTAVRSPSSPTLRAWLRDFPHDLYERTRAGLVAAGILRQTSRRRLGGLVRADTYLVADTKWPVIARARLRYLATGREQPDDHTAALAGLVAVLGLSPYLYLDHDTAALASRLRAVADQHYRPVQTITAAVDAALGDLVTATYR